jgi:hypothetical protein
MMLAAILAGFVALSARPAAALEAEEPVLDHETWRVLGWNDECGVALEILAYPKLGTAMAAEPITTRAGTATIPVGEQKALLRWTLEANGPLSWDPKVLEKAEAALKKGGFSRAGYPETIRDLPDGPQPLLAETIRSTDTLSPRLKTGWPGPKWRWAGADYNPLSTCALLVFESRAVPRRHSFLLARTYNPRVRADRAFAHASNARLLFNDANLDAAAAEAETAARLDPTLAIARYEHAALLALTGHANEAVAELTAAVKLDPKYRARARDDVDFEDLRGRDDFKAATR